MQYQEKKIETGIHIYLVISFKKYAHSSIICKDQKVEKMANSDKF